MRAIFAIVAAAVIDDYVTYFVCWKIVFENFQFIICCEGSKQTVHSQSFALLYLHKIFRYTFSYTCIFNLYYIHQYQHTVCTIFTGLITVKTN